MVTLQIYYKSVSNVRVEIRVFLLKPIVELLPVFYLV